MTDDLLLAPTPTAWIAATVVMHGQHNTARWIGVITSDQHKTIALCGLIGFCNEAEAWANAALIASSKHLLEAMIDVQAKVEDALGDWVSVEVPYVPEDIVPLKEMQESISDAFEKLHAESA